MVSDFRAATYSEFSAGPPPDPNYQRRESVFSKQPIYSFSYNRGGAIDDQKSADGVNEPLNSDKLALNTKGQPINLRGSHAIDSDRGENRKLDKKLLHKGGKLRKGTVFRTLEK